MKRILPFLFLLACGSESKGLQVTFSKEQDCQDNYFKDVKDDSWNLFRVEGKLQLVGSKVIPERNESNRHVFQWLDSSFGITKNLKIQSENYVVLFPIPEGYKGTWFIWHEMSCFGEKGVCDDFKNDTKSCVRNYELKIR